MGDYIGAILTDLISSHDNIEISTGLVLLGPPVIKWLMMCAAECDSSGIDAGCSVRQEERVRSC